MERIRQLDLIPPSVLQRTSVTMIGVGAIGSCTAVALAKMGIPQLEIWDDDVVGGENCSCSFYRTKDIGHPKVDALEEIIKDFEPETEVIKHQERYQRGPIRGIVICAVDSLQTRRELWEMIGFRSQLKLYIDARMGAEVSEVYAVDPRNERQVQKYKESLNGKAVELPCTARSTIYCTMGVAGRICSAVKGFLIKDAERIFLCEDDHRHPYLRVD